MKALFAALFFCLGYSFSFAAPDVSTNSVERDVQVVFAELRTLEPMQPGRVYTVQVGGTSESGLKEQFLRRRTAQEVHDSGLSCGCGDYALLFIARIEPQGFDTLFVEGAEISSGSLKYHFSGHAVVAIRGKSAGADAPWMLVDSTNLKILSRDWFPTAKSFQSFGNVFWIGYCGPLQDYRVRSGEELKVFYTRTLADVPVEFYNLTIPRINLTVDPSLIGEEGQFLNARLASFLRLQSDIFAVYGIEPKREADILLTRGLNNAETDLSHSDLGGWISHLGLQSGCSAGLLSYYERILRRQELRPVKFSGG